MQLRLMGQLFLGDTQFLTAGFDGQAKGYLKGRGGGHESRLPGCPVSVYDIRVDLPMTFR